MTGAEDRVSQTTALLAEYLLTTETPCLEGIQAMMALAIAQLVILRMEAKTPAEQSGLDEIMAKYAQALTLVRTTPPDQFEIPLPPFAD